MLHTHILTHSHTLFPCAGERRHKHRLPDRGCMGVKEDLLARGAAPVTNRLQTEMEIFIGELS